MDDHRDLFLSHASEDKETVARPLARLLREAGVTVWLDETELEIGKSLRRQIDEGLARSRFGVVILSPDFLRKRWPQLELDGLFAREDAPGSVILPVLHGLRHEELAQYSPILADRYAAHTSDGLTVVAVHILQRVRPGADGPIPTTRPPNPSHLLEGFATVDIEWADLDADGTQEAVIVGSNAASLGSMGEDSPVRNGRVLITDYEGGEWSAVYERGFEYAVQPTATLTHELTRDGRQAVVVQVPDAGSGALLDVEIVQHRQGWERLLRLSSIHQGRVTLRPGELIEESSGPPRRHRWDGEPFVSEVVQLTPPVPIDVLEVRYWVSADGQGIAFDPDPPIELRVGQAFSFLRQDQNAVGVRVLYDVGSAIEPAANSDTMWIAREPGHTQISLSINYEYWQYFPVRVSP